MAHEFHEVLPITREEAKRDLERLDPHQVVHALLRSACHDEDWRWVQAQCLRFATHDHSEVRGMAALCLGHLARIHGQIDLAAALPVLHKLQTDTDRLVAGQAENALDDIRFVVPGNRP